MSNPHHFSRSANIAMVELIAEKLGELKEEVVFVGGCAASLLLTDPKAPDVRQTYDVDCVVDVISLVEYNQIEHKLRKKGFTQSIEDKVICRWRYKETLLDIMPTDKSILGFSNRWYKPAIQHADKISLSNNTINIVSAPYFIATKLEDFKDRGRKDYLASHDLEDIISIIDGRVELLAEIESVTPDLKSYISNEFTLLVNTQKFKAALPGHLNYGTLKDERTKLVWSRIQELGQLE